MFHQILSLFSKQKKLLVLDLDNTLLDFAPRNRFVPFYTRFRPFLQYFMTVAQEHYNIVIWSSTDMDILQYKLRRIQRLDRQRYNIWFCLDITDTRVIKTPQGNLRVKPLKAIWDNHTHYNQTNTLIIDDIETNFQLNPRNGLRITPYELENCNADTELLLLTGYIRSLAKNSRDFSKVDHKAWRNYIP